MESDARSPALEPLPEALWQPEFSWLTDTRAVGGSFPRGVAARLARECGIAAVIDVRLEDRDHLEELQGSGIAFLHLPTEDVCGVSQEIRLMNTPIADAGTANCNAGTSCHGPAGSAGAIFLAD